MTTNEVKEPQRAIEGMSSQQETVESESIHTALAYLQRAGRQEKQEILENPLVAMNRALDQSVRERLAARLEEGYTREKPERGEYVLEVLQRDFENVLSSMGIVRGSVMLMPPARKGLEDIDLAYNCAKMAAANKRNPKEFAEDLAGRCRGLAFVQDVTLAGPFLNFTLDMRTFAPTVLERISNRKDLYGHFNQGNGSHVLVDYSGPNIAKNMTVAHMRSTIIGQSICNIYEASGYTAFRVNHLGDWGTQIGKVIFEYQKNLREQGPEFLERLHADPPATLMQIYRDFCDREEEDPASSTQAEMLFLRLERGDPELLKLWEQCRVWSIGGFMPVYERLRVSFDALQGESFYEDRMPAAIQEAVEKGVLQIHENGAIVLAGRTLKDPMTGKADDNVMKSRLSENDNTMVWRDEIVVKPSGGTVYLTRDIAAIKYRAQELKAEKILYVIGREQERHCLMLMNIASEMDIIPLGNARHLSFGHLKINGKKMGSRKGEIRLLNDVLDDSIAAASRLLSEHKERQQLDPALTMEEEEAARVIGTGTLIYNDLRQDREGDIEFDPASASEIKTGGCPYIQYTHCRLKSISEKCPEETDTGVVPDTFSALERFLVRELALFPRALAEALEANAPHRIAVYVDQLTQTANAFYHAHDVAKANGKERTFRLALVRSCQQVIKNAMALLHIELPNRM